MEVLSEDILLQLVASIEKKILIKTPFDTSINIISDDKDNIIKPIDDKDEIKKEQYAFVSKYMYNGYKSIKKNEFIANINDKNNNDYIDSLLKAIIKDYLQIKKDDSDYIDSIIVKKKKITMTIQIYLRYFIFF